MITRRELLAGAALAPTVLAAARPKGPLVENTMHLWAADQTKFPYHANASYKPEPAPLEKYIAFVRESKLDHTVIVQSEPYQDDHSYLEYCFAHEPSPGYFKGTCLFDPIDPKTPARMEELMRKNPGRIVAMRTHQMIDPKLPPETSGPIKNRDLRSAGMKNTWSKARDLGIAIQVQFIPANAALLGALAAQFPEVPLLIDHLGLPARGTPAEYEEVYKLAKLPRTHMKVSQFAAVKKENQKPMMRRLHDTFGPDRLVWGSYGSTMPAFEKALADCDELFDFASEADRVKIRGGNAMKLFKFA